MKVTIKLIESEDGYIATCPELDINCYASNRDEATKRIVKVLKFYIESAEELGLEVEKLESIKIDGIKSKDPYLTEQFYQKSTSIN